MYNAKVLPNIMQIYNTSSKTPNIEQNECEIKHSLIIYLFARFNQKLAQ